MSDVIKIRTGACLCGGVTYECRGDLRDVINCHCSQCLKTHGHYAAYTSLPLSAFSLTDQRTLRWYRSSEFAQRGFCSECGASLFWQIDGKADISVAAGTLDSPTGLKTAANIFCASRSDYYTLADGLPCHAGSLRGN